MILGSVGSNDALFTSIWHPTAPKLRYHLHLNRGAPGPHLFGSKNHLALLPGATHGASGAEEGNEPSTPVRSIKTAKLFSRSPDPPADVGRLSQHNNHCFAYKDLYNIYIYIWIFTLQHQVVATSKWSIRPTVFRGCSFTTPGLHLAPALSSCRMQQPNRTRSRRRAFSVSAPRRNGRGRKELGGGPSRAWSFCAVGIQHP